MSLEECTADHVRYVNIDQCSRAWQNSLNCLKIEFAIPLKAKETYAEGDLHAEQIEFELTNDHLVGMWVLYGQKNFLLNGFPQFIPPDAKKLLFIWITISGLIIGTFLVILYFIWKIDFLKDYRRMHWNTTNDKVKICKSDIDISMYPSPHQAVPTLFPSELNSATNANLPYGNYYIQLVLVY